MDESKPGPKPWWGSCSIDEQTGGEWHIGPLTLWLFRALRDWRVLHRPSTDPRKADPMAERSDWSLPLDPTEMASVLESEEKEVVTHRYSVGTTEERVALEPLLADRPVVTRPEHPLSILPGEAVTLYVSTPVWVRVRLIESDRTLQEIPSHRMSDTWFGPSTREGELCYATRTTGRLRVDSIPRRLHRALTPLHVRNRSEDALALERVQLPTPHLALYTTPNDVLWTEAVTMIHTEGMQGADVQIKDGPPSDVDRARRLQDPRESSKKGLFTSTFSAFGAFFGA